MSKLPRVSLFQIFLALVLPNIISIGLQLGKLSEKNKRANFLLRHSVVVFTLTLTNAAYAFLVSSVCKVLRCFLETKFNIMKKWDNGG